jgi:hypothetical protein
MGHVGQGQLQLNGRKIVQYAQASSERPCTFGGRFQRVECFCCSSTGRLVRLLSYDTTMLNVHLDQRLCS